ncbi:uncharacterized protein UBRO_20552 [Ustilago bromivora]|uniref:Uncharacterized protein n=1 Tax=Ustilago bromivora TaxID=307758 RepID=A0A1K0FZV3_9BASI|nr:uncharacterized protein UBRO_20552 [Ustilago bromivora]
MTGCSQIVDCDLSQGRAGSCETRPRQGRSARLFSMLPVCRSHLQSSLLRSSIVMHKMRGHVPESILKVSNPLSRGTIYRLQIEKGQRGSTVSRELFFKFHHGKLSVSQPDSHVRTDGDQSDHTETDTEAMLGCGSARWLAGSKAPIPP